MFLLLDDFNSHNIMSLLITSLGCMYTDNCGQAVEEFLDEELLIFLLNNNEPIIIEHELINNPPGLNLNINQTTINSANKVIGLKTTQNTRKTIS